MPWQKAEGCALGVHNHFKLLGKRAWLSLTKGLVYNGPCQKDLSLTKGLVFNGPCQKDLSLTKGLFNAYPNGFGLVY